MFSYEYYIEYFLILTLKICFFRKSHTKYNTKNFTQTNKVYITQNIISYVHNNEYFIIFTYKSPSLENAIFIFTSFESNIFVHILLFIHLNFNITTI